MDTSKIYGLSRLRQAAKIHYSVKEFFHQNGFRSSEPPRASSHPEPVYWRAWTEKCPKNWYKK